MDDCLTLIGRSQPLFGDDLSAWEAQLAERVRESSFLVIGGAGSIGSSYIKTLLRYEPGRLYVIEKVLKYAR